MSKWYTFKKLISYYSLKFWVTSKLLFTAGAIGFHVGIFYALYKLSYVAVLTVAHSDELRLKHFNAVVFQQERSGRPSFPSFQLYIFVQ